MGKFDYIVIGSGIAGLNFALNAAEKGRVLIITKKHVAESSTNYAQGGISAVLDKADSFEKHVKDTIEAGAGHNVRESVEFMVEKGPEAIRRLIEFGVEFDVDEGHIDLRLEGGHSKNRIVHVGDYTGKAIEEALVRRVREHDGIEVWEDAFALDLLVKERVCYGVQVIRGDDVENIFGEAVVLATGGLGQIYKFTSNPSISTGDGLAMGARVGCEFNDMEFVQFHPTAFCWDGKVKFLLSEALRGEGAYLCRKDGGRIGGDLGARDVVARAVYEESKQGEVFLKFSEEEVGMAEVKFPHIYRMLKEYGLDLGTDMIPVMPAAHFICGGVKTDLKGRTGVERLFAFGEVAWTGVHGANRLGSNSLLEALVFSGEIIGELSVGENNSGVEFDVPKIRAEVDCSGWKDKIQETMWNKFGIVRRFEEMELGLGKLRAVKAEVESELENGVCEDLVITLNMATAGILVAEAALGRKESLGGHFILGGQ